MTSLSEHRVVRLVDAFRKLDASGQHDFTSSFLPHLNIVEIRDNAADAADHSRHPSIVFEYTVQPEHCNHMSNLHGGATATLFDFCTSMAVLLADEGGAADAGSDEDMVRMVARSGVSRTLAVTYLRPAPSGTPVLIDCEVLHAGRQLSSLRGLLRRRSDGAVLATCEHGKAQSKI